MHVILVSQWVIQPHFLSISTRSRTLPETMCSWILRTFKSRSPELMLTTWKALVLPILDYCSQLWCPIAKGEIQKLEKIQQSFTRKIKLNTPGLNYWDRLKHLRLYSLERRRERYRILYVWKILENLVPNIASEANDGFTKLHSARNGVFVKTPSFKTSIPPKVWKLREGSLQYHRPSCLTVYLSW